MVNRVISVSLIDELLAAGHTQLRVFADNIVTPLAKEYAAEKGFALVAGAQGEDAVEAPEPAAGAPSVQPAPDPARIRKAVIAALGYEPVGLDAAIAKAMV